MNDFVINCISISFYTFILRLSSGHVNRKCKRLLIIVSCKSDPDHLVQMERVDISFRRQTKDLADHFLISL